MMDFLVPHMLLLKFSTHSGIAQVYENQLSAPTCNVSAIKESVRAMPKESLSVASICIISPHGSGGEWSDNPLDETFTLQAELVKDLKSTSIFEE